MGAVSIRHSINQSLSLQAERRDYVSKCWYFIAEARVASHHHLSINFDLSNPIVCATEQQTLLVTVSWSLNEVNIAVSMGPGHPGCCHLAQVPRTTVSG